MIFDDHDDNLLKHQKKQYAHLLKIYSLYLLAESYAENQKINTENPPFNSDYLRKSDNYFSEAISDGALVYIGIIYKRNLIDSTASSAGMRERAFRNLQTRTIISGILESFGITDFNHYRLVGYKNIIPAIVNYNDHQHETGVFLLPKYKISSIFFTENNLNHLLDKLSGIATKINIYKYKKSRDLNVGFFEIDSTYNVPS